jgi:methylated-DNA-protein-cysteine methyltransferase related protein
MAKSPFFARIKADVLQIIAAIPEGRVVSFADVGTHLDVVPRHVAYILATLEDDKKMTLPWHRAVSEGGKLGAPKFAPDGTPQEVMLRQEGWSIRKGELVSLALPNSIQASRSNSVLKARRRGEATILSCSRMGKCCGRNDWYFPADPAHRPLHDPRRLLLCAQQPGA